MLRWFRSGLWWVPLLFAILMGSVGFYSYRVLERSTQAQLQRELHTILQADIEALKMWLDGRRAVTRAVASSSALRAPIEKLQALVRGSPNPAPALAAAPAADTIRQLVAPVVDALGFTSYAVLDPGATVLAAPGAALLGRRLSVNNTYWETVLAGETIFVRAVRDVTGGDSAAFTAQGAVFQTLKVLNPLLNAIPLFNKLAMRVLLEAEAT